MTNSGQTKITLPTDEQILITREFAAPKHLVYRAWTEPALVKRWWGGLRSEMKAVDIDLRLGGKWRYVMLAHGFELAFRGEYWEIVPNERLVMTHIYEGAPEPAKGEEVVNTVTFTEHNGRTLVEVLGQCPNQAVRDSIARSGMDEGVQEQMDIIDKLLLEL
jgi:uncharacterized protein YndB with AHSA1/START domain